MISFMVRAIMGYILIVISLCVLIGSLWVLRIAIDWFWDFDYVKWLKGEKK